MSKSSLQKQKTNDDWMYKEIKSINKEKLISIISERLPNISSNHIKSVVAFLADQLEQDLLKNKTIEIGNFCNINLYLAGGRRARNYYTGEIIITKPFNKIKVIINKKLREKLKEFVDVAKSLSDD